MPLDKNKNYSFITKDSSLNKFKIVNIDDYKKSLYGSTFTQSLPLSASINIECLPYSDSRVESRKHIYALKNVLNSYSYISPHYSYSSSLGNKETQRINFIDIPSIFYGSSIQKGSVELTFEISGTVIAKLNDSKKNGELIQIIGSNGSASVAGVVLYNEGFVILTGSWPLDLNHQEVYDINSSPDTPKWIYWGSGNNSCSLNAHSSSYNLDFDGTSYINTITMLAHAEKNELNHSNNLTFIDYSNINNLNPVWNSLSYTENQFLNIKNTTKYPYDNYTGSLEKQTFITKIGIFDENKNLIAVAKLSKPVKKTENRDFTFKLKIDI